MGTPRRGPFTFHRRIDMAVKKATWLGHGTLRALAIPRGRTKAVHSGLLTGAVMRMHGDHLVIQDARTGLVEHQGSSVDDAQVRTIRGFRGYAPDAVRPPSGAPPAKRPQRRPAPTPVPAPEPVLAPEPEPVREPEPEPVREPEPEPVLEPGPDPFGLEQEDTSDGMPADLAGLLAEASTKELREIAKLNDLSASGGAKTLLKRLDEHYAKTGALIIDGEELVEEPAPDEPTPAPEAADAVDELEDELEDLI